MPICPGCRTEQTKRVQGQCPNCKVRIDVYKDRWFLAGPSSPPTTLLKYFEDLVSASLSVGRTTAVNFSIPIKGLGYKRELAQAGYLIELADYDLSLAKEALTVLFSDKKFSWKTRQSLLWIKQDFILALAIARSNRKATEQVQKREADAVRKTLAREDVFL